jgi:hypothetical protein
MIEGPFPGATSLPTEPPGPRYSICTLMSDGIQYQACLDSCRAAGFDGPECEFLYADNRLGNAYDGYGGLNRFLRQARGRYIVICHQDIVLPADGRARLDACIAEVDALDPAWGVLGNAGGLEDGSVELRITDPRNPTIRPGFVPVRAMSLDEVFLVVRADANLALSRDLTGFHLYAADLCLVADILGWSSWLIDFPLHHLSPGTTGAAFATDRLKLMAKYRRGLRPRIITTTCTTLPITGSPVLAMLGRSTKGLGLWRRLFGAGG